MKQEGMFNLWKGLAFGVFAASALIGCKSAPENASATGGSEAPGAEVKLSGEIAIDGSSTVAPIMEAVAEEFGMLHPALKLTVGTSGTGGGMKKFAAGEIDMADASRPIKPSEIEALKTAGIEFVEIPIAFDGLSVVVNKENSFVDHLTVAELKKIWEPGSQVKMWSDIRAGFPAQPIRLFGPGTDSGTFDYFTEAINGKGGASRTDFSPNEDDNVLVQGIAGDKNALGYFGYAYYIENKDRLKVVPIQNEGAPAAIAPSEDTINNGTYAPLSRPLFLYVNLKALERPEVMALVKFIASKQGQHYVSETGYVALPEPSLQFILKRIESKQTGSTFVNAKPGMTLEEAMHLEEVGH